MIGEKSRITLTAKQCDFQGESGYMVQQINNGKVVCEQFVLKEGYESFCKQIDVIPEIIG